MNRLPHKLKEELLALLPPTIFFFRNTLFGDLMFTGLFAGVMEWLAKGAKEPSLLDEEAGEEEETEGEKQPVEAEVQE